MQQRVQLLPVCTISKDSYSLLALGLNLWFGFFPQELIRQLWAYYTFPRVMQALS